MEGLDEVFDNLNEEAPVETQEAPQEVTEAVQEVVETPHTVEVEAPATEAPQEREDKSVPLATFLDMRDRQKDADRRAAELERQIAEMRQAQQQQKPMPDLYDMKPEEVSAYFERLAEEKALNSKFEISDVLAKREYGEDAVETAIQWAMAKAQADPMFAEKYKREAHPIDFIVRQHRQEADLTDYRTDPVAFARRILEANGQQIAQTPAPTLAPQPTVAAPKAPPRSLVNAPSHGGVSEVPIGKLAGMDTVFPG